MIKDVHFHPIDLLPGDVGVILHFAPTGWVRPTRVKLAPGVSLVRAVVQRQTCEVIGLGDSVYEIQGAPILGPNHPMTLHIRNELETRITFEPLLQMREEAAA